MRRILPIALITVALTACLSFSACDSAIKAAEEAIVSAVDSAADSFEEEVSIAAKTIETDLQVETDTEALDIAESVETAVTSSESTIKTDGGETDSVAADSVTADGVAADSVTTDGGNSPANLPEGEAMASLISWMIDGTFSFDFEMTGESAEGTLSATGSLALDKTNIALVQNAEQDGQIMSAKIIIKDGITYIIDDASKMILSMAGVSEESLGGMVGDYSGIVKTGSGTGEINGKNLPYEDYTTDGQLVRYFLDGGDVYAIQTEIDGYKTTMFISNASGNVPSGAFDLPEGYTEISM
jgi:outer membrane lipoprotein-sorting protein